MISKAITMHFCFMMTLTILHVIICITASMHFLSHINMPGETKLCSTSHLFNHGLYLAFNLIVLMFFFDCARNARIHSTDVLIFTTKRKAAKYGVPIPFIQFGGHFVANIFCQAIKFPGFHTLFYCSHLVIELGLIYFYFGWYQRQLVSLTDSHELDEIDTSQHEETFRGY